MAAILQTTLSIAFSWMKMLEFQKKNSLKFVPMGPINNIPPFGSYGGLVPSRQQAIIWTSMK